jgi:Mitochondrial carrier protein
MSCWWSLSVGWTLFLMTVGWLCAATAAATTVTTSHGRRVAVQQLPLLLPSTRRSCAPIISTEATKTALLQPLMRGGGQGGKLQHRSTAATVTSSSTCTGGGGGSGGGPWKLFCQTILDARRHLTAAAIARSTSIFAMYPADAIKTRLQMKQQPLINTVAIGGNTFGNLYKGVGGSLLGQVPYGVLTFGSYELYKGYLLDRWPTVPPIFKYAVAAVLGDLTGSGWLCTCVCVKREWKTS